MRHIDEIRCRGAALCAALAVALSGCGAGLAVPYQSEALRTGTMTRQAPFFAESLCVAAGDIAREGVAVSDKSCVGLFDVTRHETLFAQSLYARIHPASLTKIMTALVAIENGDLTKTVVCSSNVVITESGAQKLGLREGDRMTLDQALHVLLMYSANDAAILVAESVAGSVERFAQLMNERAVSLGATGCHFVNPHGLTDKDHYVTGYDMYLIFQEALQYKEFRDILSASHYSSSYRRADGTEVPVDIRTTNGFLTGAYQVPEGVTVVGGKTGTTAAAGHNLVLCCQNAQGEEFIAVVMRTPNSDTLVKEMSLLLGQVAGAS